MNIQCQQCGTSYAVADEKVRGRLMKVRCKSCSEVIRVDGTLLGAADGSSAPPQLTKSASQAPVSQPPSLARPEAEGAVWHITVGDSTQGPYTLDELREYYAQGSVQLDTLVYREGFDAWRPAGEVPELAAASPTQSGALAFAGGVSMGSDPFGERRPQASSQSPRVSAAEMLDENVSREHTVQFSVDQIRALSSVSQPVSHAASNTSHASSRMSLSSGSAGYVGYTGTSAGYAGGDGSGLIDVRKLAELHRAMTEEQPVRAETESSSLLPAQGSYAHTLAPLSLPLPPSAAQSGIDGKTKLIAGLAAFGMVLAAAVGVLALTRPLPSEQRPTALAAAPEPIGSAPIAALPEEEEATKPAAGEAKAEAPEAAPAKAEARAADDDDGEQATASHSSGKRSGKRSSGASSSKKKADVEDEEEPVAKAAKPEKEKLSAKDSIDDLLNGDAPSKPAKGKNSSPSASIDDLLDNAVAGASKKPAPKVEEKAPASDLPAQPGRDQMLAAFAKAKGKTSKCKGTGIATAQIQLAGSSGKATSVKVTGVDGPAAACVEKAVRSTAFPKFQKDSFEVKFPFKLGS